MNKYVVALAFSGFTLGLSQMAFADTPPGDPNCDPSLMGAGAGAACVVGGNAGTCTSTTCPQLDYANPNDAGYPGTKQVPCVKCVDNGSGPPDSEEDSSCSMSAHGTAKLAIPWLLALGVSLAFRKKRR